MSEPGLIRRIFFTRYDGVRMMQEDWDVTIPGCPVFVIDHTKWGTGGSVRDERVKTVTHLREVPPGIEEDGEKK